MLSDICLREETPADCEAIREVNRLAFGGCVEADLVDKLRAAHLVIASLVAVQGDRVVGHILFSELPVETSAGTIKAASLAPMAVVPGLQRRGIGSAMVRCGLDACRERGYTIVIVVGHPEYYPRFGFSVAKARSLQSPFSGDAFMALELTPGALDGVEGAVKYPPAFGLQG